MHFTAYTGAAAGQTSAASALCVFHDHWVARCASRLQELRPSCTAEWVETTAADLWSALPYHDPVLAAEMEHESIE